MILGINEKWFRRREVVKATFSVQPELPGDKRMLESLLPSNVTYARHKETTNHWHGGYSVYEVRGYEPVADTLARAERKFKRYIDSIKNDLMCLFYDESTARSAVDVLEIRFARMVEKFKEETKGER